MHDPLKLYITLQKIMTCWLTTLAYTSNETDNAQNKRKSLIVFC